MKRLSIALLICSNVNSFAQNPSWPVLKHYDQDHLDKIAMPIGGIGTGNISIGGNGQWKDVEIMNKPAVGYYGSTTPKQAPCFMVFTRDASGINRSKALMGPIPNAEYAGSEGSNAPNHGLPRFSNASFDAAYPFAIVNLDDNEFPVKARLKTFNPFIPGDADASGIPVAIIRYEITNTTDKTINASIAGSIDNFIGMDGSKVEFNNFNRAIYPMGQRIIRIFIRNLWMWQGS